MISATTWAFRSAGAVSYAIRNEACAEAFTRANQDRIWTEAIQKRDAWISGAVALRLIVAALTAWLFRE